MFACSKDSESPKPASLMPSLKSHFKKCNSNARKRTLTIEVVQSKKFKPLEYPFQNFLPYGQPASSFFESAKMLYEHNLAFFHLTSRHHVNGLRGHYNSSEHGALIKRIKCLNYLIFVISI
jgi:hypothetical protein